jgi:hypothetical protein
MPPQFARLAGLGAFGACAAFALVFMLIAWASRHTSLGGMMSTLSIVTWISVGLVFVALIVVHVYIGKQLIAMSDGKPRAL